MAIVAMTTGAATATAEPRVTGVAYWHGVNERLNSSGMRVFTKAPGVMEKVRLATRYDGESAAANAAIDSTQHHEDIWVPRGRPNREEVAHLLRGAIRERGFARLRVKAHSRDGDLIKHVVRITENAIFDCDPDRVKCDVDSLITQ